MSTWTKNSSGLLDLGGTPKAVYRRPLGLLEVIFYWDGVFNGTADTLQQLEVEVENGRLDVFTQKNIVRAWISLKQQFPLLGAHIEEELDGKQVSFRVSEDCLKACRPEEVVFHNVASLEEAQYIANQTIQKRKLHNNLIAKLFVFERTDKRNYFHIYLNVAHCITDGIANTSLLYNFLDRLSCNIPTPSWDLETRLALAIAQENLTPSRHISTAKKRWRQAIADIILTIRLGKTTGGHTLPRKFSSNTLLTPGHSGQAVASFSNSRSASIIQNCRKLQITFNNALTVIAQVALTRILCEEYVCGRISEEEWDFRKREPLYTGGPINIRPFLDPEWFKQGGSTNAMVAIGFFHQALPFMPLGIASKIKPGDSVPSYYELLSPGRFLLRCRRVKKQTATFFEHPLFFELQEATLKARAKNVMDRALVWRRHGRKSDSKVDAAALSPMDQTLHGTVLSHAGSSFGNVDSMVPLTYPLTGDTNIPVLRLRKSSTTLHCRPAELYLTASTSRQQLRLAVFWDRNVFEEELVEKWLTEVKGAIKFYLERSNDSVSAHL